MKLLALLILLVAGTATAAAQEQVSFTASDGITVYGDYYAGPNPTGPVIIAFHQANFNRLEYREIAPRLVKDGFSVLAIDQRSGGNYGGVDNRTAREAKGVAVVLAFSPGEYFDGKPSVRAAGKTVTMPVFITSRGDKEKVIAKLILEAIASTDKTQYIPEGTGVHGSSALLLKLVKRGKRRPPHLIQWVPAFAGMTEKWNQKSVFSPPSCSRRATKASISSRMAGSSGGS